MYLKIQWHRWLYKLILLLKATVAHHILLERLPSYTLSKPNGKKGTNFRQYLYSMISTKTCKIKVAEQTQLTFLHLPSLLPCLSLTLQAITVWLLPSAHYFNTIRQVTKTLLTYKMDILPIVDAVDFSLSWNNCSRISWILRHYSLGFPLKPSLMFSQALLPWCFSQLSLPLILVILLMGIKDVGNYMCYWD